MVATLRKDTDKHRGAAVSTQRASLHDEALLVMPEWVRDWFQWHHC